MACCKVHKVSCQDQGKSSLLILKDEKVDNDNDNANSNANANANANANSNANANANANDNDKAITENSIINSIEDEKSFETDDSSNSTDLSIKLKSSLKLKNFLKSHPYLSEQLPVLLARINRTQSNNLSTSQLARDLENKQRILDLLKEAIETDPKISELYSILRDEDLI